MAILTSPDIVSKVVDLNVDQYAGYQLVEIPFTINDNASDITLTLRFDNEFEDRVSIDIADLYIDKSTQTTLLFYNGQKSFNELEKLKLYSYPETNPREYNTLRFPNFSEQDLLNTLWLKNVHPEFNPNYGNIVHLGVSKDFSFFKTWFKGFDGSNNLIFDSDHLTNSDLESSDCWYFLTKSPNENSITKTYYRYITENNIKYLEIITNNCSEEGTNNYAVIQSEIKRYLCNGGKLIRTTKTVDIGDDNPKTSITDYEYFTNGELKKVQTSSGEEIIVLYEASQNYAGYVSRKTSGLNSVDVTYDNYLEKTITQNKVNGSTISHSLYTKTINYDSYLGRVFSNNFNYNNYLNVSNKCQVYYQDNVMYFSNNIHSLYALEHNVSENKMYFKRFNGQNHENVISLAKDNISSSLTYYDSSNIVINNNYDACGKQINQSLNNDTKVIFTYENTIESPTVAHISSVLDKYLDPSGKSTTMTYHHSGGSLKQLNFDNSSFIVSIDELNIETDYTIGSNLTIQVNRFYDWIDYRITSNNMFSRSFSNERDAYQRIVKTFYDTSLFDWLYAEYSYLTSTSLVSSYA
ncbi:MAG: hypothetical protein J5666_06795, partial [Bacilli bacterium]|nr:hypothetical protein [Bacilli bacterium]